MKMRENAEQSMICMSGVFGAPGVCTSPND
jgi:hypothetical protein